MATDSLVIRDRTRATRPGAGTGTISGRSARPWLLHGLFRSEVYQSHTAGVATVEVALVTDDGYATGTIVPTDGADPDERAFADYFSGGEPRVADKAAITFRANDPDTVVPVIHAALERAIQAR